MEREIGYPNVIIYSEHHLILNFIVILPFIVHTHARTYFRVELSTYNITISFLTCNTPLLKAHFLNSAIFFI